jgi:hypothetical protein
MLFQSKNPYTSAIMAATLALMFSGTSALAGSEILQSNIPQIYGKSKDIFQGSDAKTIIHIQDAHGNVESQENIQAILKTLSEQGKVDAIMDEGGLKEYDLSNLKDFSQADKQILADWYNKYGLDHGATFYKLLDDPKIPVIGSEEKSVYLDNVKAFREAGKTSAESLAATAKIKAVMEAVKLKMFDAETRDFLQTLEDFEKDSITLTTYANALKTQADKTGVNFAAYPNFTKVIESIALEEKLDFSKIDSERLDLVEKLESKVEKKDADTIVSQTLNYRLGKVAAAEYYKFILEQSKNAKLDMGPYGNVTQYSQLVNLYASINDDALFAETDRLENAIKEKLFKDPKQVEFDWHIQNLDVLNRLINLQMTRANLAYWKENRDKISTTKTIAFLKNEAKALGLGVELQDSLGQIDEKLAINEKFYELAIQRDDIMVQKTLALMDERGFKTVVLVAGGFHSEGIVKALKAKAISHMIVTPRITNPDAENFWKQNMLGEETEGTKLLAKAGINTNVFTVSDEGGNIHKASPTLLASIKAAQVVKEEGGEAKISKAMSDIIANNAAGISTSGEGISLNASEDGLEGLGEVVLSPVQTSKLVSILKALKVHGVKHIGLIDPITDTNSLALDLGVLSGNTDLNGVEAAAIRNVMPDGSMGKLHLSRNLLSDTISEQNAVIWANEVGRSEAAEVKVEKDTGTVPLTHYELNKQTNPYLNALNVLLKGSDSRTPSGLLDYKVAAFTKLFENGDLQKKWLSLLGAPTDDQLKKYQEENPNAYESSIENVMALIISPQLDALIAQWAIPTVMNVAVDLKNNKVISPYLNPDSFNSPVEGVAGYKDGGQNLRTGGIPVIFSTDTDVSDDRIQTMKSRIAIENGIPYDTRDARIVVLSAEAVKNDSSLVISAIENKQYVILAGEDFSAIKSALEKVRVASNVRAEYPPHVQILIQEGTNSRKISKVFGDQSLVTYDMVRGIPFAYTVSSTILNETAEDDLKAIDMIADQMDKNNQNRLKEARTAITLHRSGKILTLDQLVVRLTVYMNELLKANDATAHMA